MKKLLFTLGVMLLGYTAFSQQTDTLLNQYIRIKNALVNDDSKAATVAIKAFQQAVNSESSFAEKEALVAATEKLAGANDLEKQRTAFAAVSVVMWKVVKESSSLKQEVYYQYCPMKKAYWLSKESAIENPYYGSSMLTCGKVAETKKK